MSWHEHIAHAHIVDIVNPFRNGLTRYQLGRPVLKRVNGNETVRNSDTASFHFSTDRVINSTCPLCNLESENAFHFLIECPALQDVRTMWFSIGKSLLSFSNIIIMGIVWISQDSYQGYLTGFVAALRETRLSLLT